MISKKLFPLFKKYPDLIYLDSSATALKPETVISAERKYEEEFSANISRGLYPIAEEATDAFEMVRKKTARFINADPEEIIFTSGTTDGINLTARLLAPFIGEHSNIVITELEHHSNFLPWKELARSKNIELRIAPFTDEGTIDIEKFLTLIDDQTAIIAFSAISNVLGGINPVTEITHLIREKNEKTVIVIDAAQAVGHIDIDVRKWNTDFIAFSGHKMYGPTGIGVLYGKKEILEKLSPVTFGGGMVTDACTDTPVYREVPYRFEAGTPNISGAIGLGMAIDFITDVGVEKIRKHDIEISAYAIGRLKDEFGDAIKIIGSQDAEKRSSLISFTLKGIHPHDLAELLGEKNICIRAGEHCAGPLHRKLNLPATARISFGIYNDTSDIDRLAEEMRKARDIISNS